MKISYVRIEHMSSVRIIYIFLLFFALLEFSNATYSKTLEVPVQAYQKTGSIFFKTFDIITNELVLEVKVQFDGTSLILYTKPEHIGCRVRAERYSITISHPDYDTLRIRDIAIASDSSIEINLWLHPRDISYNLDTIASNKDYEITVKKIPDPGGGEINGIVFDKRMNQPIHNVNIVIKESTNSTKTDKFGKYTIIDPSSKKQRLEIEYSYPGYETMLINLERVNNNELSNKDIYLEHKPSLTNKIVNKFRRQVRLEFTEKSWKWHLYQSTTTIITLHEGDRFGTINKIKDPMFGQTFKVQEVIDRDHVSIDFDTSEVVVIGEPDQPQIKSPITISYKEVCFRTRTYDSGYDFCFKLID